MATKTTTKTTLKKEPIELAAPLKLTNRGECCVNNRRNRTLPKGCEKYRLYFEKFVWPAEETDNDTKQSQTTKQ